VNPAYGLRRIGIEADEMRIEEWAVSHRGGDLAKRVAKADIVFLQRNAFGPNLEALRHWRDVGKPVYVDLDDAYQLLPKTNHAHAFWLENSAKLKPPPLEQLREALSISSGLTSPSKVILEDWQAPKKLWLPNYVRGEWYIDVERRPREHIVIGWGGSMSHQDSFRYSGFVDGVTGLCRRDRRVRVCVSGNDRGNYEMFLHLPSQQRMYVPGVKPEEWPAILAQFDLGVAPLYSEYDRRRSWLKVAEYACAGVPCIVTDSDPYQGLDHWCIRIANGADAWEKALSEVVARLLELQATACKRRVEAILQFGIESNAGRWLEGLTK